MAFTQQAINYAQQYAREMANAYPYLNYFAEVYASPNNAAYKPVNAQTVLIPSMEVSGARAVNRNNISGNFSRNFNVNYEPKEMSMYREWDTIVDPMDIVETNEVATIANITKTFNQFQKTPEMDAYAASKLAGFADTFGGIDSTTLTSANILTQWDSYLEYMTDQRVNRDRLVVHVTPAVYTLLKQAAGITRFIEVTNGIQAVDRNVSKLDGVTIIETPADVMKTAYDFTNGWDVAGGASQINMLFVDPLAVIAPVVYDVAMLTPPSAATKGKYVYYESYYYDVFNLMQRQAGFFANKSAPNLGVLVVTSVAGTDSGDTLLTITGAEIAANGTTFNGIDLYVAEDAAAITLTYGAALPSATWTKIASVTEIAATTGNYVTVAAVNRATGKVVAGGNAVVVAKA